MGARRKRGAVVIGLGALMAVAVLRGGAGSPGATAFPIQGDPARGQRIFERHCQLCHGARGFGDGPIAERLPVGPRSFHRAQLMQARTDPRLFRTVTEGGGRCRILAPSYSRRHSEAMTTVFAGIVLLGVLVFVHELGHFLVAKACGVRVLVFSLGFGPRILGVRRGETDYRLSAIPLGGYVRMYGDDVTEEVPEAERDQAFLHKPIPQKSAIALAGPLANFLLPLLLFFFLFVGAETVHTSRVGTVVPGDPAAEAGLRPGDRIVAVDDVPVTTFAEVQEIIEARPKEPVRLVVERDGERLSLTVTPRAQRSLNPLEKDKALGRVGIMPHAQRPFVQVAPGSPAAEAGLLPGDRIEAIDGKPVETLDEALERLAAPPEGPRVLKVRSHEVSPPPQVEEGKEPPQKPEPVTREVTLPAEAAAGSLYPQAHEVDRYGVTREELADETLAASIAKTREIMREVADEMAARGGIGAYEGTIHLVEGDTPAARLGVEVGDRAVVVDGERIHLGSELTVRLLERPDDIHVVGLFTKEGEGRILVFRLETEKGYGREDFKTFGAYAAAGLYSEGETLARTVGPGEALVRAAEATWNMIVLTLKSLWMLVTGQASFKSLGGPITIVSFAGQAAEQGLEAYVRLMAFISVNLGIINLLPVPVLDGGHLLMFGIEGITRRRLDVKTRERAIKVGFFLLLILIVAALFNDVLRHL